MAILDQSTLEFMSSSVEQTVRLGVRLGELLQPGDLICLSGDLGAGKTAVARGIGRGWGTHLRVTSPTFVLMNEYPRLHDGRVLYHIDAYRLDGEGDLYTAGLEIAFEGHGATLVEWPERIQAWLPPHHLWISLQYVSETKRQFRLQAKGKRAQKLLDAFKKDAFGV